ncbi:MAG: dethiobiotin synthase [Gammaproteobacteria bacterium]|nr:dethiobiotin synthase [Gammaproteobacteria bacterium]
MAAIPRPDFGCLVTGTDTGVGKTWISVGLLHALSVRGRRVAGMKPVASGAEAHAEGLRNADALLLQSHCTSAIDYDDVNPYLFTPPIAPHIAAARAGTRVRMDRIRAAYARLCAQSEAVVVEGIGGWRVPLGPRLQTADLVRALDLPVVMVVGLKLGCINHALLTAEAIATDGVCLAGWVANAIDADYEPAHETVDYLQVNISAPLLGTVAHLPQFEPQRIAAALDLKLFSMV